MKAAVYRATVVRTVAVVVLLASLLVRAPVTAQNEPTDALWSEPVNLLRSGSASAPLIAAAPGENGVVQIVVEPIGAMPELVADTTGRVHAFWLGPSNRETGLQPQLLSRR